MHEGRLDPGITLITTHSRQQRYHPKLRNILDASEGPSRILVVEDELLILDAGNRLQRLISGNTAGTATEATNKLGLVAAGVDAIIVDIGVTRSKG